MVVAHSSTVSLRMHIGIARSDSETVENRRVITPTARHDVKAVLGPGGVVQQI